VNLQDRILRTSRRIGFQRAVVTSVAAAAVLAVISTGAVAAITGHRAPDMVPAILLSSSPVPTSTPSVAPLPSAAPTTPPPSASSSAPASLISGTSYYVVWTSGQPTELHAVGDGSDVVLMMMPDSEGECPFQTLTVSPGGDRIAWINDAGDLYARTSTDPAPRW
jgi:hypothetical protein